MCTAEATVHGLPSNMRPSISRQLAACPPIHENREWTPQAQEEQPQYPQPGYRIPVKDARELRREATLENVAEHQRYLENLQFELNTPRLWSTGIPDEIMDEAQKVHLQLMRMIRELQRLNNPQPWVEGWQVASSQAQPPPASA